MTPLLEQILDQRNTFTPAQARIADYLQANTLNAALLTATELAQQVDVDPATVVRFAQKLGYPGYLEFKTELGRWVRGSTARKTSPTGSLGQAIEAAHEQLQQAYQGVWGKLDTLGLVLLAELLGMPYHLLLISDRECKNSAHWLADELRDRGFRVDDPRQDAESLAGSMLDSDIYDRALILEGTTPAPAHEHIAQELQRKQIRTFAIHGSETTKLSRAVDVALSLQPGGELTHYPAILRQVLATILLAVGMIHANHQNPGENVANPEGPSDAEKYSG